MIKNREINGGNSLFNRAKLSLSVRSALGSLAASVFILALYYSELVFHLAAES